MSAAEKIEPEEAPAEEETPDEEATPDEEEQGEEQEDGAAESKGRCEAETEVGGTLYRCALETMHDGEHSFTPLEDSDDGEVAVPAFAAPTEKELAKREKLLEKEAERHTAAIVKILGADSEPLVQCEACPPTIAGWHDPPGAFPEGNPTRALYELLAGGSDAQMLHPARYETCETCNGFGQVLTGARNDLNRLIVCPDCKASGYHDRATPQATVYPLTATDSGATFTATEAPPVEDTDFLGRPRGHPNFGKMTTYLTPDELIRDQQDGFGV